MPPGGVGLAAALEDEGAHRRGGARHRRGGEFHKLVGTAAVEQQVELARGVAQPFAARGGEPLPGTDVLPAAHHFKEVVGARMLLEEFAADLDRCRAVPCRRLGGAILPLVGLGADRGLPAPGVFAGQHAAPPAEVEPREVLAHDRRLRERIFGDLALEEFGREHVEGVGAGL